MQDLTLALVQTSLHWEQPEANMAMLEEKVSRLTGAADVIVLPEMFTTGFSMNAATLAEPMHYRAHRWMKQVADRTGALVLGSFITRDRESAHFYNRLMWMEPGGEFKTYDKRHLFRMAEEEKTYTAGDSRLVAEWKGWKICPLICYDLRFPVWSRNSWLPAEGRMAFDLLVYVANWPKPRSIAWSTLLRARAIENLCYCAGVNRVGSDGKGIEYEGLSAAVDPKGVTLASADDREEVVTVRLSGARLLEYREKFPAWRDADRFEISG
jgi:predicted amidohydrolase